MLGCYGRVTRVHIKVMYLELCRNASGERFPRRRGLPKRGPATRAGPRGTFPHLGKYTT